MECQLLITDSVIEQEVNLLLSYFVNKVDFRYYYLDFFNIIRQIFKIYDEEKIEKYANLLIYQLIHILEYAPTPQIVFESINFALSNSFYITKPYWFFGIIDPISKNILLNNYLFNNPKFLQIIKSFYSVHFGDKDLNALISLIYVRYLIANIDIINPLDIWNDIYYFFNPYFKGLESNSKNVGIYEYIYLLKFFKDRKNGEKFISKISSIILPILPFLNFEVQNEFKKILLINSFK